VTKNIDEATRLYEEGWSLAGSASTSVSMAKLFVEHSERLA